MTRKFQGWVAGAMALAAVGTAEAMPIAYDEAVDGDISDASFIFDTGGNTIQGSGSVLDFDNFAFTIQLGQELLSVMLAVDDVAIIDHPALILHLVGGDATAIALTLVDGPLSSSLFDSELPFGAGTYSLFNIDLGPYGFGYDYELTFEVSSLVAIPEPSSLALFGFGLTGLGALGWLRQGRKARRQGRAAEPS